MIKLQVIYIFLSVFGIHGDLDIRIQEKSLAIAAEPANDTLYLERGDLYFHHEENLKAIQDFKTSDRLNSDQHMTSYLIARSYFALGKIDSASIYVDRYFLSTESKVNIRAVQLHAKILLELDEWCAASEKFDLVISLSLKTIPKYYLDAADAHLKCGGPESVKLAISQLHKGKKRLGPLFVLNNRLMRIYKTEGDLYSAIHIQTEIIDISIRKEIPLFKRAKLWVELKDEVRANVDLNEALNCITNLPMHTKNKKATMDLENEILDFQQRLNKK